MTYTVALIEDLCTHAHSHTHTNTVVGLDRVLGASVSRIRKKKDELGRCGGNLSGKRSVKERAAVAVNNDNCHVAAIYLCVLCERLTSHGGHSGALEGNRRRLNKTKKLCFACPRVYAFVS